MSKVTLSGKDPCPDYSGPAPCPIDQKTGMHQDYWILSQNELDKGFIRPIRQTYKHIKCGQTTTMNIKIAETYAVNPKFYSGTFCATCGSHFPVDEFVWKNTDEKVGS